MNDVALQQERRRQQMLLRALWGEVGPVEAGSWLRDAAPRVVRGLQAYRANAGASAERALAAAFPTVAQLVGGESFAALARALWFAEPPERGDMAQWGAALPVFIAASAQLAGEPYLADVARLDWAVHGAEQAAERAPAATGLERLADAEPAALRLRLAAEMSLVSSPHPVATIWHGHRSSAPDRFEPVRQAFARAAGEHALVWRDGYKAQVSILPEATARFMQPTLDGRSLGRALDLAGADFAFEPWLVAALRQGWLQAVEALSHG